CSAPAAAAVPRGTRHAGFRTEERLVLHADLVPSGDDDLRIGRRRLDVPVPNRGVPLDVALLVDQGGLGRQRMLGVGDRIQDLVVHADLFHRTACRLRMVGSYERNRLSLVTHPLAREYRLVVMFEPVGVLTGNVLVGEYRVHPRGTDRL